jgi:hypothetical protein
MRSDSGEPQPSIPTRKTEEQPGFQTLFDASGVPAPLPLPASLLTTTKWTKADDENGDPQDTFSQPFLVRNEFGEAAYLKPGVLRNGGSLEAVREVLASHIGRWLGLAVPRVELYQHPELGRCCVSRLAGAGAIMKRDGFGLFKELRNRAGDALLEYVPIVVLDVLVGVADRTNRGNHLFVASENRWYGIDYALAFNQGRQITGVGDPTASYEAAYWDGFMTAVALNSAGISDKLREASRITEEAIEGLVALIPESFATDEEKRGTAAFLKRRVSLIEVYTRGWLRARGIGSP